MNKQTPEVDVVPVASILCRDYGLPPGTAVYAATDLYNRGLLAKSEPDPEPEPEPAPEVRLLRTALGAIGKWWVSRGRR